MDDDQKVSQCSSYWYICVCVCVCGGGGGGGRRRGQWGGTEGEMKKKSWVMGRILPWETYILLHVMV